MKSSELLAPAEVVTVTGTEEFKARPLGTTTMMAVSLQNGAGVDASTPPNDTVLLPCELPKLDPEIATQEPTIPEPGASPSNCGGWAGAPTVSVAVHWFSTAVVASDESHRLLSEEAKKEDGPIARGELAEVTWQLARHRLQQTTPAAP